MGLRGPTDLTQYLMAKSNSGYSAIAIVGVAMFVAGMLVKSGGSGEKNSAGGMSSYAQSSSYQQGSTSVPVQASLPITKNGAIIANPESYVPKTVITQKPVKVGLWEGQNLKGTRMLPPGTELKLKAIEGYSIYIDVDGHWEIIEASATDLLEQMTQAAGEGG